jgi:hypothetical protein
VPNVGLVSLGVVKVLMTENHLAVAADATISILSASADRARVRLAAVEELSSRLIKAGYH